MKIQFLIICLLSLFLSGNTLGMNCKYTCGEDSNWHEFLPPRADVEFWCSILEFNKIQLGIDPQLMLSDYRAEEGVTHLSVVNGGRVARANIYENGDVSIEGFIIEKHSTVANVILELLNEYRKKANLID